MHVNELPELTFDYKTIFTVRNSSCGKVMFSQASVILSTEGHAWQGGMHGWGGGAYVAGEMATAADGTHPTGM